ncbi:MAG: hypothetical protein Q9217_006319 [Psora testacea]
MPGNVVKAFVATGSITKGTKSIVLGVATHTSNWSRPESGITETMKTGFKAAVQGDTKALPAQAEKIVMRIVLKNEVTVYILKGLENYIQNVSFAISGLVANPKGLCPGTSGVLFMCIVARVELENGGYLLSIRASALLSSIVSSQDLAQINSSISDQDSAIAKLLELSLWQRSLHQTLFARKSLP